MGDYYPCDTADSQACTYLDWAATRQGHTNGIGSPFEDDTATHAQYDASRTRRCIDSDGVPDGVDMKFILHILLDTPLRTMGPKTAHWSVNT